MEDTRLVSHTSCRWNRDCPDCGKVDHGNIRKFGRTAKGTRRYQCKTCKETQGGYPPFRPFANCKLLLDSAKREAPNELALSKQGKQQDWQ